MNHEAIALAALKRKRDDHQAHVNRLNLAIEALNGGGAKTKAGPSAGSLRMKKAWAKRKANAAKAAKAEQIAALKPEQAVAEDVA